jgi:hypothetical protein
VLLLVLLLLLLVLLLLVSWIGAGKHRTQPSDTEGDPIPDR